MSKIVLKINLSAGTIFNVPKKIELELAKSSSADRAEIFEIVKLAVVAGAQGVLEQEEEEEEEEECTTDL